MRYLYAIALTLIGISTVPAQSPLPQSTFVIETKAETNDYDEARKLAATKKAFLVSWIADSPIQINGAISASLPEHADYKMGDVVISGPWGDGRHVHYTTLTKPTRAQIEAALKVAKLEWQSTQSVGRRDSNPKWPQPSAKFDDDLLTDGPWPIDFPFPEGMQRYKRAAFTQEIAVTNNADRITPMHRTSLHSRDNRWLVSGGMLGIDGIRSDLYRNQVAEKSREYVGNISVLNSLGYHQNNRGWRREFDQGSKFMDVLSYEGTVFEIRQREKGDSRWNSEVIYESEKARPPAYAGLNKSCVSCHNAKEGPGTGPYAGPLVLGSDTVFSVPFKALERGR